jgi:hypothetical protein
MKLGIHMYILFFEYKVFLSQNIYNFDELKV